MILSATAIEKHLAPALPIRLELQEEVTSTNLLLREQAAAGAPEGSVLIAASQTAGRGRLGRSFFSPDGSGLYMSLLLRPRADRLPALTTMAASAMALAIERVSGRAAQIKWVNDIWQNGRKLCGILTEAAFSPGSTDPDFVILGAGVNVFPPRDGFPPELSDIAGTVFPDAETAGERPNHLAAEFLNVFTDFYCHAENRDWFAEYRSRSFLLGRHIYVLRGQQRTPATALDLDSDCHLLVRYGDGREEWLSSGEVSIRPTNLP